MSCNSRIPRRFLHKSFHSFVPQHGDTTGEQLCLYIELASRQMHATINKRINKAIIVHNNPYQKGGTHWRFLPASLVMTKRQYAKRNREKERDREGDRENEKKKRGSVLESQSKRKCSKFQWGRPLASISFRLHRQRLLCVHLHLPLCHLSSA